MKLRRRNILSIVILVLILSAFVAYLATANKQQSYKGKPIDYWFHQLPLTFVDVSSIHDNQTYAIEHMDIGGEEYGCYLESGTDVANAFLFFGTNSLPLLLGKLSRSPPPFYAPIQRWSLRLRGRASLRVVPTERMQAVSGLLILKLPPECVARLSALSTNKDRQIAESAQFVLGKAERITNQ